ncbi:MAG: SseB family protein [Pedobacter sp.]
MLKKLKALFAGIAVASSVAVADAKPPVDVNTPVTNPKLVAAIQRLKLDASDEAKDALLIELNKANYLVAIFSDEMHTSEPGENGRVTVEKDSIIKVLNTSDGEGNMYLPLFTDWEAIGKYIDQPVDTLIFPSQDAWYWALNMGEYHGVVINPAEDALPLSRAQIEYLANEITDIK